MKTKADFINEVGAALNGKCVDSSAAAAACADAVEKHRFSLGQTAFDWATLITEIIAILKVLAPFLNPVPSPTPSPIPTPFTPAPPADDSF